MPYWQDSELSSWRMEGKRYFTFYGSARFIENTDVE